MFVQIISEDPVLDVFCDDLYTYADSDTTRVPWNPDSAETPASRRACFLRSLILDDAKV
jgi:hypothetical protein